MKNLEKVIKERYNKKNRFFMLFFIYMFSLAIIGLYHMEKYYTLTDKLASDQALEIGLPSMMLFFISFIIYSIYKIFISVLDEYKIKKEVEKTKFEMSQIKSLNLDTKEIEFFRSCIK